MSPTTDDMLPADPGNAPEPGLGDAETPRIKTTRRLLFLSAVVALSAPLLWFRVKHRLRKGSALAKYPIGPIQGREMVNRWVAMEGISTLLTEAKVQKDLGLSQDQVRRLKSVFEDAGRRLGARIDAVVKQAVVNANLGIQQDPTVIKNMKAESFLQTEKAVRTILTPAQYRRLGEISFQSKGLIAHVTDPEIASQLGLSHDQRSRIDTLVRAATAKKKEIGLARQAYLELARPKRPQAVGGTGYMEAARPTLHGYDDRMRQTESAAIEAIEEILTTQQKSLYRSLTGPPFDFTR